MANEKKVPMGYDDDGRGAGDPGPPRVNGWLWSSAGFTYADSTGIASKTKPGACLATLQPLRAPPSQQRVVHMPFGASGGQRDVPLPALVPGCRVHVAVLNEIIPAIAPATALRPGSVLHPGASAACTCLDELRAATEPKGAPR